MNKRKETVMKRPNIYRWLLLLVACVTITACVDEFDPDKFEEDSSSSSPFSDGYSLDFTVTIDDLGEPAGNNLLSKEQQLEKLEKTIDLENFRILFFANDEENGGKNGAFLFESRTRFVKEMTSEDKTLWRVSVPLFAYGNGAHYGWNWEEIRIYLREHPFKIAILANHPQSEWSMPVYSRPEGNKDDENNPIVPATWYDNSAPHWDATNSLFGKLNDDGTVSQTDEADLKHIFDLHHSQYDPIYYGKNWEITYNKGQGYDYKIYDFITIPYDDELDANNGRPALSPTSSWVSWAGYDGAIYDHPEIYLGGKTWTFADDAFKSVRDIITAASKSTNSEEKKVWKGPEVQLENNMATIKVDELAIIHDNTSGEVKIEDSNKAIRNNDVNVTSGKRRLCFSFTLPVGTWNISVNARRGTNKAEAPSTYNIALETGEGALPSSINVTSTAVQNITFSKVEAKTATKVYIYGNGDIYFYGIKYTAFVDEKNNNRDPFGWSYRKAIHPSKDYLIPMYGIQEFDAIKSAYWDWGSPYDLSNPEDPDAVGHEIALLRSVVRLDLYLPQTIDNNKSLDFVLLWYSNVFARCEPMDVWTSTGDLWEQQHKNNGTCSDWTYINAYGPVTRGTKESDPKDDNTYEASVRRYQERMSWFYGIWTDRVGWDWNSSRSGSGSRLKADYDLNTWAIGSAAKGNYPQIFNPCVQRNGTVDCTHLDVSGVGENPHIVVYTGERNINDPSNLLKMGAEGTGAGTVIHWMIGYRDKSATGDVVDGITYSIPIVDYSSSKPNPIIKDSYTYNTNTKKYTFQNGTGTSEKPVNRMGTVKDNDHPFNEGTNKINYETAVQHSLPNVPMPLPLIRNHKYVLNVNGSKPQSQTRAGDVGISVSSEVQRSQSLRREFVPKTE